MNFSKISLSSQNKRRVNPAFFLTILLGAGPLIVADVDYRISYPPMSALEEGAAVNGNIFMNDVGHLFWTEFIITDQAFGKGRMTTNILKPVGGEYSIDNVQRFPAPVSGNARPYLIGPINSRDQFSMVEETNGTVFAYFFNGGTYELINTPYARDLDNPPTYAPKDPVFHWRGTSITAISESGQLYGTVSTGLDTGPPLNVTRSGIYRWNSPLEYEKLYNVPDNLSGLSSVAGPNILGTSVYEDRSNPKKIFYNRFGSLEEIQGAQGNVLGLNNKDQVFGANFIYLPSADYGLPDGLSTFEGFMNLIPSNSDILYRNNLLSEFEVYEEGAWQKMNLIDPERPGFVPNIGLRIYGIDKDGNILAGDIRPVDGVNVLTVMLIERVGTIKASVRVEPKQVEIGETFKLIVDIKNESDQPFVLAGVFGDSFQVLGTVHAGLEQLENPPPTNSLPPRETFTQVFPWKSSQLGNVQFSLQGTAFLESGTQYLSPVIVSDKVNIIVQGDLLIKRESQNEALFGEDDVYQDTPLGQQRESISVIEGQTATFDIQVQNDSALPATFFLQAEEDIDDQWTTAYALGESDIKTAVLSGEGYSTGELQPGASLIFKAKYTPTTAELGGEKNVLFRLYDEGGTVVDTLDATAKRVELQVIATMHELGIEAFTGESLDAGFDSVDEPLSLKGDKDILSMQEEIRYGLVGDGVTPLLFKLEADPTVLDSLEEDFKIQLKFSIESGGLLGNESIQDRLRILSDGSWISGDELTFNADSPIHFAYLSPIAADDVRISEKPGELSVLLQVYKKETEEVLEDLPFYIRKPPIFLIHGYNTDGEWGTDFINTLHSLRPRNKLSFVSVIKYGQQVGKSGLIKDELNKRNMAYINTIFPLKNLVPLASQSYDQAMAVFKGSWAVTRHDVIAHSQGGVLTRMMCANQLNQHLPRTFRSESDFYRGRFHRIVTVGSPQNGTRILYYMRAIIDNENLLSVFGSLPVGVAELMVALDVSQNKFDPFDSQIREINDPATIWTVDEDARFHIIRTTVSDGMAPSFPSSNPSDYGLFLAHELGGILVLPRGSDGVVDWDSMGCHGPGGAAPPNVHTISGTNIAHATAYLFGGDSSQTASPLVANHALSALGQGLSPSTEVFDKFPTPPLLPNKEKEDIDLWASNVSFNFLATLRMLNEEPSARSNRLSALADAPTTINLSLSPSPDDPIVGSVNWVVEVYDQSGVSYGQLIASPVEGDPLAASLEIPEDLVGQVVVYANYATEGNGFVFAPPLLVADKTPAGEDIESIFVLPDNQLLPTGAESLIQVWVAYTNGTLHRVFVDPDAFTAQSSDSTVVDTSGKTIWKLLKPGAATISGTYQGFEYSVDLSVNSFSKNIVRIGFARSETGDLLLNWPGVLTEWDLQKSTDLEVWETVSDTINEKAGLNTLINDVDEPQTFYRLSEGGR